MNELVTIYVMLPDEAVTVWRPVLAKPMGNHHYRIVQQPYDETTERWQFRPGEVVECREGPSDLGLILKALRIAPTYD